MHEGGGGRGGGGCKNNAVKYRRPGDIALSSSVHVSLMESFTFFFGCIRLQVKVQSSSLAPH